MFYSEKSHQVKTHEDFSTRPWINKSLTVVHTCGRNIDCACAMFFSDFLMLALLSQFPARLPGVIIVLLRETGGKHRTHPKNFQ